MTTAALAKVPADAPDPRPAPPDLEPLRRFVNSDNRFHGVDYLDGPGEAGIYFERALPELGAGGVAPAGWDRLRSLRDQVRALLERRDDRAAALLSETARAYPAVLDLTGYDAVAPRIVPVHDTAEHRIAVAMLAALHRAALDGRLDRLRLCQRPDCGWCYYDSSKNRSARWCSAEPCGDVMKARAYRARTRPAG